MKRPPASALQQQKTKQAKYAADLLNLFMLLRFFHDDASKASPDMIDNFVNWFRSPASETVRIEVQEIRAMPPDEENE